MNLLSELWRGLSKAVNWIVQPPRLKWGWVAVLSGFFWLCLYVPLSFLLASEMQAYNRLTFAVLGFLLLTLGAGSLVYERKRKTATLLTFIGLLSTVGYFIMLIRI